MFCYADRLGMGDYEEEGIRMIKTVSSICAALLVAACFTGAAFAAPSEAPVFDLSAGVEAKTDGVRVADAGDFAAGVAVGVIGSLIAQGVAEEKARRYRDEEWRWRKCDREFRSFEWDTGMYTTYGGQRRLCPYLR
jgi:hypothetical protein